MISTSMGNMMSDSGSDAANGNTHSGASGAASSAAVAGAISVPSEPEQGKMAGAVNKAKKTVSWIQEHMLAVMAVVLALIVVLVTWVLRRANTENRHGDDSPAPVSEAMVREKLEKIKLLFKPYFDELGIPLPDLSSDIPSKFEEQVEVLFELKPAVFSFIFGIPSKEILQESRKLGIKTIGAATTLEEALALEDAEVDAIIAAGFEAGGHRPSFLKPAQDSFTGLFTLIQQLKAKTKTPIIALTAISLNENKETLLSFGMNEVITKPFEPDFFYEVIHSYLATNE